jgi:hypothetical protein
MLEFDVLFDFCVKYRHVTSLHSINMTVESVEISPSKDAFKVHENTGYDVLTVVILVPQDKLDSFIPNVQSSINIPSLKYHVPLMQKQLFIN